MNDLVTWLRDQLDDDERSTRAVLGADAASWDPYGYLPGEKRDYLTRFGPDRVLAEVDAKRRILELYDVSASRELKPDAWELMKHVVRALALPYADRSGYRDEWRP